MGVRLIRSLGVVAAAFTALCLGATPANPRPDDGLGLRAGPAARVLPAADALARFACPPVAAAAVAAGKRIFSGAGNCYTCHGPDAKGTPLAPDLHAHKWLNITGSYESIDSLVTSGVPHPKEHPAPMPPKGGASLSTDQICDVAAYVYSLSHPQGS